MRHILTSAERKILSAVQLDATLSVSEVARRTRLRPHIVQYALKQLRNTGVVSPYVLVNPATLGLTDYCVFLNPLGYSQNMRDNVRTFLQRSAIIPYFAELSGEFQLTVSCFTQSIVELDKELQALQRSVKGVSFDMQFAVRLRWLLFSRGYLGDSSEPKLLERSAAAAVVPVDECDKKLLSLMMRNTNLPLVRVSHLAGISEATGRYRKESLRKQGVIIAEPYFIETRRIGYLPYRALIKVAERDASLDSRLIRFAARHHNISELVICLGAWDYEINFQVEEPEMASDVVSDLYEEFRGSVRNIRTMGELRIGKLHAFSPR